jgi:hypothetical protein
MRFNKKAYMRRWKSRHPHYNAINRQRNLGQMPARAVLLLGVRDLCQSCYDIVKQVICTHLESTP